MIIIIMTILMLLILRSIYVLSLNLKWVLSYVDEFIKYEKKYHTLDLIHMTGNIFYTIFELNKWTIKSFIKEKDMQIYNEIVNTIEQRR